MGLKRLSEAQNWLRGLDLNQGPSGYEPDELPGCSTPRSNSLANNWRDPSLPQANFLELTDPSKRPDHGAYERIFTRAYFTPRVSEEHWPLYRPVRPRWGRDYLPINRPGRSGGLSGRAPQCPSRPHGSHPGGLGGCGGRRTGH